MSDTRDVELEHLRRAIDLLETIADNARLLDRLPDADKARLKRAVSRVAHPDRTLRRKLRKDELRAHRAARVQRTEEKRHDTAIRALRRKPVFTTPNYFPPPVADGIDAPLPESPDLPHDGADSNNRLALDHRSRDTPQGQTRL